MACVTNTFRFGLVWIIVGVVLFLLLPWWAALGIFLIPVVAIGVIGVVMISTLGKVAKGIQDALAPKQADHDLAANQPFDCDCCSFALPVAAKVTEMAGHGVSMIRVVPALPNALAEHAPMILVSNVMSVEHVKNRIDPTFEQIAQKAPAAQFTAWEPAPDLGPGAQIRRISATKDGRELRCQATLTGEGESLLAWVVIYTVAGFEGFNQQVRDLAALISPKRAPISVTAESASSTPQASATPPAE